MTRWMRRRVTGALSRKWPAYIGVKTVAEFVDRPDMVLAKLHAMGIDLRSGVSAASAGASAGSIIECRASGVAACA